MPTTVETNMWELDAIWGEQQRLLPSLTLSTKAPSSVTNKFVQEHLDDCGALRFQHDPQAVAHDAQVRICKRMRSADPGTSSLHSGPAQTLGDTGLFTCNVCTTKDTSLMRYHCILSS